METKQRSAQKFCRCGHARSLVWRNPSTSVVMRNICGILPCECVKHDTATTPPKAKLKVVEPSPNAMARNAAVRLLRAAQAQTARGSHTDVVLAIEAALTCLEVIS